MNAEAAENTTILIIEDDAEALDLLFNYLHEAGFDTLIARSGEGALQQLEFVQPDLILLDVRLPGIDGFETCRRLKVQAATQHIPVIFMTALADITDKITGFEAGGIDYLTKPLQYEEVLMRVRTQVTFHRIQHQLEVQNILLEEQNTRFYQLSEATFEGIVIHDAGTIIEINRAIEKMFGFQRTELIGRNVLEFVAPSSREIVQQHIARGDEQPYEADVIKKNGERFPVEIQATSMPYHGKQVRVAAVRDLSWHKMMQAEKRRLEKENLTLKSGVKERYRLGPIIGKSPAMQDMYELLAKTAATGTDVMIQGESGTGKELVAQTIHQLSDRKEYEFVAVNCGAIPENLFESEFFGHRKGAFTGADQQKNGYFDLAHQGTLFLDEVGELSPILQVKLLRAIEQGEYRPVGSNTVKTVDVRIIAATNRNIEEMRHEGTMREDFYFRLNVISITIPPLRDRHEDIPLLVEHFWEQFHEDSEPPPLPAHVLHILYHHDWPGNIRELQNVLQRYLTVQRLDLSGSRRVEPASPHANCAHLDIAVATQHLQEAVEVFEKQFLLNALEQHRWNKVQTAKALGIGRRTLYRKLEQYGLMES